MPQHTPWSVQGLLYGLTAAAVIPATIVIGVSVANQYKADEQAAALSAFSMAQLLGDNVQSVLFDAEHVLRTIAERPSVRAMSAASCDPIFEQFSDLYPQFSNLSQASPQGYIICSARAQPDHRPTYVGNAPWFAQVYASASFIVAPPYLGPVTRRIVAVLAQPVKDGSGKMIGSVQMPLDLAKFRVVRSAEKLPESTLLAVVDSHGTMIARSRNAEQTVGRNMRDIGAVQLVLAAKRGTGRATSSDGVERVLGFVPIAGTDWYAVAGIDTNTVLSSARAGALRSLVFGVVFLLAILALAIALSKRIVRPMAAVQEAARRAAAGDLQVRVPHAGPAEVADFARQFNLMLAAIRSAQAELASAQSELVLLGNCLAHLSDMVVIMDARYAAAGAWPPIVFVNHAFEAGTGVPRGDAIGRTMRLLHGPQTDRLAIDCLQTAFANGLPCRQDLIQHGRQRPPCWVEIDLIPIGPDGGVLTHWIAIGRDISARKQAEQNIHRLAYYDVLTQLPNRPMLFERLDAALVQVTAEGVLGAVLFVDLDHFKNVNDARGHAVGDALLQVAARRLAGEMRAGDTLARLGGDEFVIVLTSLGRDEHLAAHAAMARAAKLCADMALPFEVGGHPYSATASIGVALLRGGGQSANDVLREADTAMYRAKQSGRNCAALFKQDMQAAVETRLALAHDLASALALHQLSVHLQTQVDRDGAMAGAELLLRWQHPRRGMIAPDQFIPIAEESGLIVDIGAWVIEQACRLLVAHGGCPLSVNVSARQFRHAGFVERVGAILAATGAPAHRLIFEVTESLLIDSVDEVIERMGRLAALGIRFSIDDFGTGYSSMAYLKRLPLHELKIDRSFIRDTPGESNDTAIVKMILAMAERLGLRVVAEGVETGEQAAFLVANGCHALQGFLYHRPVPVAQWLAASASAHGPGHRRQVLIRSLN